MAGMNPMKPYDPFVDKDYSQTSGAAGAPSPVFKSLVDKLAARKGVKNPEGLAASIGAKKAGVSGGGPQKQKSTGQSWKRGQQM